MDDLLLILFIFFFFLLFLIRALFLVLLILLIINCKKIKKIFRNISKHRFIYVPKYEEIIGWEKEKIINEIAYSYGWEKFASFFNIVMTSIILVIGFIFNLWSSSVAKFIEANKYINLFESFGDMYIEHVIFPILIIALLSVFAKNHTKRIKLLEAALKEKETAEKELKERIKYNYFKK